MPAMTTNAASQQHGSNNAGTTSVNEGNAIRHSHQEGNRNANSAQYPEYAHERERTMNVQNMNVGHQHPFSYTNYSPAYGWGEGHHTLREGQNQQGQLSANSHNGQVAMSNNHHNIPQAYSQGISHRYGKNPYDES